MTVKDLKQKLDKLPDDAAVVLSCEDVLGADIVQDFALQTNDGMLNSPVYLEFALTTAVGPISDRQFAKATAELISQIDTILYSDVHYDETVAYQLTSDDFEWLKQVKRLLVATYVKD